MINHNPVIGGAASAGTYYRVAVIHRNHREGKTIDTSIRDRAEALEPSGSTGSLQRAGNPQVGKPAGTCSSRAPALRGGRGARARFGAAGWL